MSKIKLSLLFFLFSCSVLHGQNKLDTIHIFIENSGSMDGYVKMNVANTETAFQSDIYAYLQDLIASFNGANIQLHYINSQICDMATSDLRKFLIVDLCQASFRAGCGKRTTTNFNDVFEMALAKTNLKNSICIVVSDFITDQLPTTMETDIKKSFVGVHTDLAVKLYHMESEFNGMYYPSKQAGMKHFKYKGVRPYYICVIGNADYIKNVIDPEHKKNCIYISDANKLVQRKTFNAVCGLKPTGRGENTRQLPHDNRGERVFSVTITKNNKLVADGCWLNKKYYTLSDNIWQIRSVANNNGKIEIKLFTTSPARSIPNELTIWFNYNKGKWIDNQTDSDGRAAPEDKKTYGLSYLVNGLWNAFDHSKVEIININFKK